MLISGVHESKMVVMSTFKSLKKCYGHHFYELNANPMQNLTMEVLVSVGEGHLQTLFGTYEQFISVT